LSRSLKLANIIHLPSAKKDKDELEVSSRTAIKGKADHLYRAVEKKVACLYTRQLRGGVRSSCHESKPLDRFAVKNSYNLSILRSKERKKGTVLCAQWRRDIGIARLR